MIARFPLFELQAEEWQVIAEKSFVTNVVGQL
jgi:hypothetical protein